MQESYIVSSNINEFVQRALDEDPDFAGKSLKEQKAKLLSYAKEITAALDSAKAIIADVTNQDQQQNQQQEQEMQNQNNIPANQPVN